MPRKGKDTRTSRHNPNTPDIPGPPAQTLTLRGQHSFVKPLASEPNPAPPPVSLDCRGKIGQTVYQLTRGWINHYEHAKELMLQRRRHVMPFDPRTNLQLLCRCRFAAAVAGWHLLTSDEKREYNRRGNARFNRIEGLNVWIRQFVRDHDLDEYQLEATLRQAQATIPIQPYPLIGLALAAPLLGDTMNVSRSIGPAAKQENIPYGGTFINNISITATKAGHCLLLAKVRTDTNSTNDYIRFEIYRNDALIPGASAMTKLTHGDEIRTVLSAGVLPDMAIGDVFKIWVSSIYGTPDIFANECCLTLVTA